MRNISLLNPYSIYHLWQYEYSKDFINNMINSIIKSNDNYNLLDFFNKSINNVRSYLIFESNNNIVLIDFNLNGRNIDDDLGIINFLESTSNKKIYLIMFNNFKGINSSYNNIYNIFMSDNIMFADNMEKEFTYDKKIADILYTMSDELYKLYLHEEMLLNK